MSSKFVADGGIRLMRERQKRLAKTVEAKYSPLLKNASIGKRFKLRTKMLIEQMSPGKKVEVHNPSAAVLW